MRVMTHPTANKPFIFEPLSSGLRSGDLPQLLEKLAMSGPQPSPCCIQGQLIHRQKQLEQQSLQSNARKGAIMAKTETKLGAAERLVREGESIVVRQRTLVLELANDQQSITAAEKLFKTFEKTLTELRKELYRIKRGK